MKMRTFMGLCAALAFAAGSDGSSRGQDSDERRDQSRGDGGQGQRHVYAKETL